MPDAAPVMRIVFPLKVSGAGVAREMKGGRKSHKRPIREGIFGRLGKVIS
jgi:hypothetical protein